jgi:hypothetical protein
MRKNDFLTRFLIFAPLLLLVLSYPVVFAGDNPIRQHGTVSFILHTDKTYSNGMWEHKFEQTLVELQGLGKCVLKRSYYSVLIHFQWVNDEVHKGFFLLLKDLPGPRKYAFHFTWDADKGLADGYMNGTSFRLENNRYYTPWIVKGMSTRTRIPPGPNRVTDVKVLSRYMSRDEVIAQVPKELHGKMAHLIGDKNLPSPMDIGSRKGKLLYSSKMDTEASVKDWVVEGPAKISFEEDKMIMRSTIPNPPDGSTGHFNYWCPQDFPESFIVEWEFKPLYDRGSCLFFFAARGENGKDIFDPSFPKRDGHYKLYHSGPIVNYYFVYFSNLRIMRTSNLATTWLFKSNKTTTLSLGQIAVIPGVKKWHRMLFIKDGGHMQVSADGKVYLDFTDPGSERWGPVLGGGKIGLRQMAATVGAYRNFNVWELR